MKGAAVRKKDSGDENLIGVGGNRIGPPDEHPDDSLESFNGIFKYKTRNDPEEFPREGVWGVGVGENVRKLLEIQFAMQIGRGEVLFEPIARNKCVNL